MIADLLCIAGRRRQNDDNCAVVPATADADSGRSNTAAEQCAEARTRPARAADRTSGLGISIRSGNDIHNSLWDDDHLARQLPSNAFGQSRVRARSLNLTLVCVAGNCQIAALLSVDLNRIGHVVVDHQSRIELRLGRFATNPRRQARSSIPRPDAASSERSSRRAYRLPRAARTR